MATKSDRPRPPVPLAAIHSPQPQGYPVVATANSVRSLSGDSDYLATRLKKIKGPIILVGRSSAARSSPTQPRATRTSSLSLHAQVGRLAPCRVVFVLHHHAAA